MANLYGLVMAAQEALITKHCFGDCGKVSLGGALMTEDLGPLFVCGEEVCPYLRGQMDEPIGTSQMTGEPIFIRGIQDERIDRAAMSAPNAIQNNEGSTNV